MSNYAHEAAIIQDLKAQGIRNIVRHIKTLCCPFCKAKELFVYPPGGVTVVPSLRQPIVNRNWWIVGCESRLCDSSWRIEKDGSGPLLIMLNNAQPDSTPT